MKKHLLKRLVISSVTLAASLTWGQTPPTTMPADADVYRPIALEPKQPEPRNRIGISYRMGLNITADFRKLGGFPALTDPGPATGGVTNRNYDDGYNRVDITGNNHGPGFENTTWYWAYQDPNSVQGNNMVLHSSSSPANAVSSNHADDLQHGFEITYDRELYRDTKWRFGVEGAFGYNRLSIADSRTVKAEVDQITDSFALPGGLNVVPPPGYPSTDTGPGTFNGPGPVISSAPVRTLSSISQVSQEAIITGERRLDANVFSFRLGPYVEVPLSEKFSAFFNGGLALVVGDTHFSFRETVTIPGVGGTVTHTGSGSQGDFLVGGYVGGGLSYALTKEVSVFTGAQFQAAGRAFNHQAGKEAILDLGESVIVSFGAAYSF